MTSVSHKVRRFFSQDITLTPEQFELLRGTCTQVEIDDLQTRIQKQLKKKLTAWLLYLIGSIWGPLIYLGRYFTAILLWFALPVAGMIFGAGRLIPGSPLEAALVVVVPWLFGLYIVGLLVEQKNRKIIAAEIDQFLASRQPAP